MVLVYISIFKIKVRRFLGYPIVIKSNTGSTVKFIFLGALEVFFAVFLGALAFFLCVMALTKIKNNIGFE